MKLYEHWVWRMHVWTRQLTNEQPANNNYASADDDDWNKEKKKEIKFFVFIMFCMCFAALSCCCSVPCCSSFQLHTERIIICKQPVNQRKLNILKYWTKKQIKTQSASNCSLLIVSRFAEQLLLLFDRWCDRHFAARSSCTRALYIMYIFLYSWALFLSFSRCSLCSISLKLKNRV